MKISRELAAEKAFEIACTDAIEAGITNAETLIGFIKTKTFEKRVKFYMDSFIKEFGLQEGQPAPDAEQ